MPSRPCRSRFVIAACIAVKHFFVRGGGTFAVSGPAFLRVVHARESAVERVRQVLGKAGMATAQSVLELFAQEHGFLDMQEVLPFEGLFIGPQVAARSPKNLRKVSHVLSVNGHSPFFGPASSISLLGSKIRHKIVHLDDATSQDIIPCFQECFEFIDEARRLTYSEQGRELRFGRGGVLVHCTLGMSRSATVVCAYIMALGRLSATQALSLVAGARRWVRPNSGFLLQLQMWETALNESPLGTQLANPVDTENVFRDVVDAEDTVRWLRQCDDAAQAMRSPPECSLCTMSRQTEWFSFHHPDFIILLCQDCDSPLLVVRKHGKCLDDFDEDTRDAALHSLLCATNTYYGSHESFHLDSTQRSVFCHAHVHARCGPLPWTTWIAEPSAAVSAISASHPHPSKCVCPSHRLLVKELTMGLSTDARL
jgi:hypothetical protein